MIDILGDAAIYILRYLDFNSLQAAAKVSQTWHDEIIQHRDLLILCHQEVLKDLAKFTNLTLFSLLHGLEHHESITNEELMSWIFTLSAEKEQASFRIQVVYQGTLYYVSRVFDLFQVLLY